MPTNLTYPVHHVSVRVPWQDIAWNGAVCSKPSENLACLKLARIAEGKDDSLEDKLAGRRFESLLPNELPPCVAERAAFMNPFGFSRNHEHPYHRPGSDTHGHFRPTPVAYAPYAAPAVPFRWMNKRFVDDLRNIHPLDELNEEYEPNLNFNTPWWQDHSNHRALLEAFWGHVDPSISLVFFYAKQVPLVEEAPGRRVLIGVGRVKSLGPLTEYEYDGSPTGKLRSLVWERMLSHSIRPGNADGFLMPYHDALEQSRDGEVFDPADAVAFAPEHRFTEFSYATEHVGDDAAIEALQAMRTSLLRCEELFDADIGKQESWIDQELGKLWHKRGPFPGLGAVLHACGVPMGNFIATALADRAEMGQSPWQAWFSVLDEPGNFLPPELARRVDPTVAKSWKVMGSERRAFLELLSRVDLTPAQAKILVTPEERRANGISAQDAEFVANPYLLYESTRLTGTQVSVGAVDRGCFPAASLRGQFSRPSTVKGRYAGRCTAIARAFDPRTGVGRVAW